MNLHCWQYVSRNLLASDVRDEQIRDIIRVAMTKNARLGVTGSLIMTDTHFAQWLEGPIDGLQAIRTAILADPRHEDIVTLTDEAAEERHFTSWSLGYAGPSPLVSRLVMGPLRDVHRGYLDGAARLLKVMKEVTSLAA